jgi:WD40 repeat protein
LEKAARFWEAAGVTRSSRTRLPLAVTALTGSGDHFARQWKVATGEPLGKAMPHLSEVTTIAVSPNGRTVLTGGLEKAARFWEAATGKPLGPPLQYQSWVPAVALLVRLADGNPGETQAVVVVLV